MKTQTLKRIEIEENLIELLPSTAIFQFNKVQLRINSRIQLNCAKLEQNSSKTKTIKKQQSQSRICDRKTRKLSQSAAPTAVWYQGGAERGNGEYEK